MPSDTRAASRRAAALRTAAARGTVLALAFLAGACATTSGGAPARTAEEASGLASSSDTSRSAASDTSRAGASARGGAAPLRFDPLPVIGPAGGGGLFFRRPLGLSLDHLKRLFIADSGNNRIVVLTPEGSFESEFGRFGDGDGQFLTPTDIAAREGFFYYVADSENERVQKFDRFRSFVEVVAARGAFDGAFGVPRGVEVDDEGRLYVTDTDEDKVWVLDAFTGSLELEIGGFGSSEARFIDPADVAIDPDRHILVVDSGNRRIQAFDRLGNFLFASDGSGPDSRPFQQPAGIACDPRGFLYVTDPPEGRVVVLDTRGTVVGELPRQGMSAPFGIAFDGEETLYISDAQANSILPFRVVRTGAAPGE